MIAISLFFPAGRYHANPWGRHVNEGAVEWPPSPYRLVRALYDAWKRRFAEWPAERVERVLGKLAASPPLFRLPPAATSHVRYFLHKNEEDPTDRTLIFDAFVVVDPSDGVLMFWPETDLTTAEFADLDQLLSTLNYLGRSESWVDASLVKDPWQLEPNCGPAGRVDLRGCEGVAVACPIPNSGKGWLENLAFSTGELIGKKVSDPPALRRVEYLRQVNCFSVERKALSGGRGKGVSAVLYALDSKVLPRVTETLEVAERVRRKVMGAHARLAGSPDLVSPRFSGKTPDGEPLEGHRHAFFMPLDMNEDGRLDHLLVASQESFDPVEMRVLGLLRSVWQPDGRPDLRFVAIRRSRWETVFEPAHVFHSATPYVTARHHRKGRGAYWDWMVSEILLEFDRRRLPRPVKVKPLAAAGLRDGRSVRWLEFRRNRKGDPVRPGVGFTLEFERPVGFPLALGYGSHFGLGMFVPGAGASVGGD